jgi:hypothetical protein
MTDHQLMTQEEKADIRFSGLYLAYRTDNSVNIPYLSVKLHLQSAEADHVSPLET